MRRAGELAYQSVVLATNLASKGKSTPSPPRRCKKRHLHRADHHYPGHTELLAELCGVDDFAMMLYMGPSEEVLPPAGLTVVHVTLHTALRNVFDLAYAGGYFGQNSPGRQLYVPINGSGRLRSISGPKRAPSQSWKTPAREKRPRIGVCALNPHAGEGGLFGDEERTVILPAVERGREEGLLLEGPLPADTIMVRAQTAVTMPW